MAEQMSRKLDKVKRTAAKLREAQAARDEAIREAAKTETVRTVAKAAGLSHSRVDQIVHGK